jgi:hypothetical protein
MRVEFLRDWRWFKRGQVVEMATGRADLFNRIGLTTPASVEQVTKTAVPKTKKKAKAKKTAKRKRVTRRKKTG